MPCRVTNVEGDAWIVDAPAGDAGRRAPLRPAQTVSLGSTVELADGATVQVASPRGGRRWTLNGPAAAAVCSPDSDAMLLWAGSVEVHGTSATSSDHRYDISTPQAAVRVSIGRATVHVSNRTTRVDAHGAQLSVFEGAGAKTTLGSDAGANREHDGAAWQPFRGDATLAIELDASRSTIEARIDACARARIDELDAQKKARDHAHAPGAPTAVFAARATVAGACAIAEAATRAVADARLRGLWLDRLRALERMSMDAGAPQATLSDRDAG